MAEKTSVSVVELKILELLYKFRFATVPGLAIVRRKTRAIVGRQLEKLVEKGLVDKYYEASYRLLGKPAYYSLSKSGVTYILKERPRFSRLGLNRMYRNRDASENLIDHHLFVLNAFARLRNIFGASHDIYTSTELADIDDFPLPVPSLFMQPKDSAGDAVYVEVFHHGARKLDMLRRLKTYSSEGVYEPLIVCEIASVEGMCRKLVEVSVSDLEPIWHSGSDLQR